MIIGIIREGKVPPDSRVPLSPEQCQQIQENHPDVTIKVEPSPGRCFPDSAYEAAGIQLTTDLSDCDLLMGVKEVPIDQLIPNKTYCFFSHTIKAQAYNRKLLLAIMEKNIRLIDYEVLTDDKGKRLIAFGRFAGMVGAHNALYTYGKRSRLFELKRMKDMYDYAEAQAAYKQYKWPNIKIVLTGTGRVGKGAAEVLRDMGIREVTPEAFLKEEFDEAVFTQLRVPYYIKSKDGQPFETKDYYSSPEDFVSNFKPFTEISDIMINGIFWDNKAPAFFTKEEMKEETFKIEVIADVTCDIAPISSIPSTLYASTIADPVFGYDPEKEEAVAPYQEEGIDMMTIDNLPNELPRDASRAFGEQFISHILPEFQKVQSDLLDRATIAVDGQLGQHFGYLEDYVAGKLV
ncbi:MAG: NAD(P)-dependent oxidoreductase [Bacteroidota bacterium]